MRTASAAVIRETREEIDLKPPEYYHRALFHLGAYNKGGVDKLFIEFFLPVHYPPVIRPNDNDIEDFNWFDPVQKCNEVKNGGLGHRILKEYLRGEIKPLDERIRRFHSDELSYMI